MPVSVDHFLRAAADIGAHGDNDMLPFDIDTRFVSDKRQQLSELASDFCTRLQNDSAENNKKKINALTVFNERLLAPAGASGFRASTKLHPFWNLYINGLGIAVAESMAHSRSDAAWSYRFLPLGGEELFDRDSSWRAFRQASEADLAGADEEAVVLQTDIASFYEHISHHHLENYLGDLFQDGGRIAKQVVAILSKCSGGRSFGLPVGGQGARCLAELILDPVDRELTVHGLRWSRFVDDFVVIAPSSETAYGALAKLSHTLGDHGLNLSRNKTAILSAKHFVDYVAAQLGGEDDEAARLREIDVYFDPYSDTAVEEYDSLRETVESLQVQKLLNRELEKSLPDNFLVTQIARTLSLNSSDTAIQLITTLLGRSNLNAFRASWSSIMRGISSLRSNAEFEDVFPRIDLLLDALPRHSAHLIQAEASLLHYLRTLRFARTDARAVFVRRVYADTSSETIRRACIDCWRKWADRPSFTMLRNRWNQLAPESQRLLWLASYSMGDEGAGLRRQFGNNTEVSWRLGVERQNVRSFAAIYREWCDDVQNAI